MRINYVLNTDKIHIYVFYQYSVRISTLNNRKALITFNGRAKISKPVRLILAAAVSSSGHFLGLKGGRKIRPKFVIRYINYLAYRHLLLSFFFSNCIEYIAE